MNVHKGTSHTEHQLKYVIKWASQPHKGWEVKVQPRLKNNETYDGRELVFNLNPMVFKYAHIYYTGPVAVAQIMPPAIAPTWLAASIVGRNVASNAAKVAGAAGPVAADTANIVTCATKCTTNLPA